jgi:hypothetical protein
MAHEHIRYNVPPMNSMIHNTVIGEITLPTRGCSSPSSLSNPTGDAAGGMSRCRDKRPPQCTQRFVSAGALTLHVKQ